MKCTTCAHPQRQAIDQALLAGDATYEALSRQYGPSISALFRHRKHLEAKTRRARARLRDNLSLGFFCKLNNFLAQIQNASQTADAEGNAAVVLKAAAAGTRIITSLAKLELPLELEMVYRFLASPQWATQDSLLPTDPQILTDSHRAIAAGLFFPCPEFTLPDLDDEDDYDDENDDDAGNKTAHEAEAKKQEELSRLLSRLDLDPIPTSPSLLENLHSKLETSQAANRKLAAENHSRIKREKSAKLPRNSRPPRDNIKQYQYDNISEKISAKNPCVGRDPQGGASQSEAPPADQMESDAPPAVQPSTPEPPLETENRKLETAPQELETQTPAAPDPFLQAFPFLRPTLNPAIDREKSAKLARKSPLPQDNAVQYQEDGFGVKTSAKNPCVGRDPQGGASQSEAPPADQMESNAGPAAVTPPATLPVNSNPVPPETGNPPLETPHPATLFQRLRRRWQKKGNPPAPSRFPFSWRQPNRQPKPKKPLAASPITGTGSWFHRLATKRRPEPPPVPVEEIVVVRVQPSERWCRGIY